MFWKTISFAALSPVFLGLLLYFFNSKPETPQLTSTDYPLPMCAPQEGPAYPAAKLFNPADYRPAAVMVRKNVYNLTAGEINSIRAGVAAMKALPVSDKTSWQYQAAIHGTILPAAGNPLWNTCTHSPSPNAIFFLSWHRMYLYFFERILRAKSGNPNLTLPYWDYQTNGAIPIDYRFPANAANALYNASRALAINNPSLTNPGTLPSAISIRINSALTNIDYYTFQSALENPHGGVHVSVGGDMSDVRRAALDPVFWLHHANIDRLWEAWLSKCGSRANPKDATWLNKTYSFVDETGTIVNMKGSQVVKTAATLNYRYDTPLQLPCDFTFPQIVWAEFRPFRLTSPPSIRKIQKMSLANSRPLDDFQKIRDMNFNFLNSEREISDQILLEMSNVRLGQMPEGVIEVYINLPSGIKPSPESRNFASIVNLFGLTKDVKNLRIDLTQAVKNLNIKASELNRMNLTFFVRGNTINGKEVDTSTLIEADNLDIIVRRGKLQ